MKHDKLMKAFMQKDLLTGYFLMPVEPESESGWKGSHLLCPSCGYYVYKGPGNDSCPCGNISINSDMLRVTIENFSEAEIQQFKALKVEDEALAVEKYSIIDGCLIWDSASGNSKTYRPISTQIKEFIINDRSIVVLEMFHGFNKQSNLYRIDRNSEKLTYFQLPEANDFYVEIESEKGVLYGNSYGCFKCKFDINGQIESKQFTK